MLNYNTSTNPTMNKLIRARRELLVDQGFFGRMLHNLEFVICDRHNGFPVHTMGTDGKHIFANPSFVSANTIGELKGVLCHEVLHVTNYHHLRRSGRDFMEWNESCDYAINPVVLRSGLLLPAKRLYDTKYDGKSAEYIYNDRHVEPPPKPPQTEDQEKDTTQVAISIPMDGDSEDQDEQTNQDNQSSKEGDNENGDGQDSSGKEEDETESPAGSEDADFEEKTLQENEDASPDGGGRDENEAAAQADLEARLKISLSGIIFDAVNDQGKPLTRQEAHATEVELRALIIHSARMVEMAGGELSGDIRKLVVEAKNPPISLEEVLRNFVYDNCTVNDVHSWRRPNRRFIDQKLYMPGWDKKDTTGIVVIKDTSGSVNDYYNAEFDKNILRLWDEIDADEITVIAVDAVVKYCQTFTRGEPLELSSLGGGGTAFAPAFRKIEELQLAPKAIIYFTDLKCYDYGVEPACPLLWVQWGNWTRMPPFGQVVKMV